MVYWSANKAGRAFQIIMRGYTDQPDLINGCIYHAGIIMLTSIDIMKTLLVVLACLAVMASA